MKRKLLIKAALALALLLGVSWSSAQAAQLIGLDAVSKKFYSIPIDGSSSCTEIAETGLTYAITNGVLVDGTYYVTATSKNTYYRYAFSTDTWTKTQDYSATIFQDPFAITYGLGQVYGIFYDADTNYSLGTLVPETGEVSTISSYGWSSARYCAMVTDPNTAKAYAIKTNGQLDEINVWSGTATNIGNTNIKSTSNSGAVFDTETGTIYYTSYSNNVGELYSINVNTAEATKIATFGQNNFVGLAFVESVGGGGGGVVDEPKAPGDIPESSLQAFFTPGNLNGYITFDMPSTNADGTPATGSCKWAVEIDWGGTPVATGTANYGETGVRADIAFPAFDEAHTIRVYAEVDGAGSSNYPACLYNYTVPSAATPKKPGLVTNLGSNFEEGSLQGTITFDMPTTYEDGSEATGPCGYAVRIGFTGDPVATGSSEFGATGVSVPLTLAALDVPYSVAVWATTDAGAGEAETIMVTSVSPAPTLGAPADVTNLDVATEKGNKTVRVKFDMPTADANGTTAPEGTPLKYMISVRNNAGGMPQITTGESTYGGHVEKDVTVGDFASYTCAVVAVDAADETVTSDGVSKVFTVEAAAPELGAPADVNNLEVATEKGNKTVRVKFDMPTADANGTTAPEGTPLNYMISVRNNAGGMPQITTGESTYGGHVEKDVDVAAFASYTCAVVAVDAADETVTSDGVSVTFKVEEAGPAAPMPVSGLEVATVQGDKNVTVRFTMPTQDVNGNTPAADTPLNYTMNIVPTTGLPLPVDTKEGTAAYGAVDPIELVAAVPNFDTEYKCQVVLTDATNINLKSETVTMNFTVAAAPVVPVAPGKVTDLKVTTTPGSKVATLTFTMPTKMADGSDPADGAQLIDLITLGVEGGEVHPENLATEECHPPYQYGQAISYTIDLTQGNYDFGTKFVLSVIAADLETYGSENELISEPVTTSFTLEDVPVVYAAPKPVDVETLVIETTKGSKDVNIKFTMPSQDVDGKDYAEGTQLTYKMSVKQNGALTPCAMPEATVAAGTAVTVPVTVNNFAMHECAVYVYDANGQESTVVSKDFTVEAGPAAPGKVTNLNVATTPGSKVATLTFTTPTAMADETEPAEGAMLFVSAQLTQEGEMSGSPIMFGDGSMPPVYVYGANVSTTIDLTQYDFGTTFNVSVVVADFESMSGDEPLMSEPETTTFTLEAAPVTPPTPSATELVGYFVSPTSGEPGVYSINTEDGSYTLKKALKADVANAVAAGEKYYLTTKTGTMWQGNLEINRYGYDMATWEETLAKKDDNPITPYSLAYCSVDEKIYAVFPSDANDDFCKYNYETGEIESIKVHIAKNAKDDFISMAITPEGTVYAVRGNGKLFTLDRTTGEATEIGETGLKFSDFVYVGSTIDPATGTLYLAHDSKLYTVNVTTGAATELVALEGAGRVVGLGMMSTEAPAPKPMPVEEVSINFEGEALEGNVTFTTPTKLTDGTDGTGDLYWEVKVDDNVISQSFRPVGFGQQITTPNFTLEAGEYEFAVSVYTDAGSSEPVKITKRVGPVPETGITPPYTNALNTEASAEGFTKLNLNDDGLNWVFDTQNEMFYMGFNQTQDMNAWFITPDINLEAGKLYEVSLKAYCGNSKFPERVAMWLGTEADPNMMFIPVVDPTEIRTTAGETLTGYITVNTDGKYYLGIKGCSDKDSHRLYISDLSISAPRSGQCPGNVYFDLKNTPGSLDVEVTLDAPSVDAAGNQLVAIEKIELRRDAELIKTFENPTMGETLKFTDKVPANGTYTYSTVAVNSYGAGPVFKVKQFIGTPVPASPTNARVVETAKEGEVTVTWDAPTTDAEGNPIDPSTVRYYLVQTIGQGTRPIADDIEGTSYTFQAVEEGAEQDMLQFGVFAKTSEGIATNAAMTEFYPAGPAYKLPVEQSFADGEVLGDHNWAGSAGSAWWEPVTPEDAGIDPQDGDNGFITALAEVAAAQATLYFGKIAIPESAVNPVLTYWYYKIEDGANTVATLVDADGTTSTLNTAVCGPEDAGWTRAYIPLDAYKGKNIRIKLVAAAMTDNITAIDNIRVFDQPTKDLTAVSLNAPTNANAGSDVDVTVKVLNSGRQAAADYTVELFVDDKSVEKKAGTTLNEGESTDVKFNLHVSPAAKSLKLKAVVNFEGDENKADNTTDEATIEVKASTLPAPTNLMGDVSTGSVVLNWTAPKLNDAEAPKAVTDIFDDIASFTVDPDCGWTFIDVDGQVNWTFTDVKFPNEGYQGVGIVYDGAQYPSQIVNLTANSGDKSFVLNCAMRAKNDDWMISPELIGAAQNVSFYARPVQPLYPETFEIYYSTTGKEISDFKLIKKQTIDNTEWDEFTYSLPEGAKYFAIRYISNDLLALAIDDITYLPATADVTTLTLKGYNVYRDDKKINENLVTETTFTDKDNADFKSEYFVTAVYEQGESAASNKVMPTTGVDSIYGSDITVMAGRGVITVAGAEGMEVAVYTTDGRTIFNEQGAETTRIRTEAGVYVVKAGTVTRKVVVK